MDSSTLKNILTKQKVPISSNDNHIQSVNYINEKLYMILQLYCQNKNWSPSIDVLQCFTDFKEMSILQNLSFFQMISNRITLDTQGRLILRENGKIILPFEHFGNAVMLKHASGPHGMHLGIEGTIRAVKDSYTMGRENFGMDKEFIIEVLKNCTNSACRYFKDQINLSSKSHKQSNQAFFRVDNKHHNKIPHFLNNEVSITTSNGNNNRKVSNLKSAQQIQENFLHQNRHHLINESKQRNYPYQNHQERNRMQKNNYINNNSNDHQIYLHQQQQQQQQHQFQHPHHHQLSHHHQYLHQNHQYQQPQIHHSQSQMQSSMKNLLSDFIRSNLEGFENINSSTQNQPFNAKDILNSLHTAIPSVSITVAPMTSMSTSSTLTPSSSINSVSNHDDNLLMNNSNNNSQEKIVRAFSEIVKNIQRMKTCVRPSMCKPYGKQSEALQKTLIDTVQLIQSLRNFLPPPHIHMNSWKNDKHQYDD